MTQDFTTLPAGEPAPSATSGMGGEVARSGLWTVTGQSAGLLVALVATPFTIRLLGEARYGLWALLQTGLIWVGLADLGMTTASTRFAGEAHERDDADGESVATWTATTISVLATCVVAGIAAILARPIVTGLMNVPPGLVTPGVIALRILAIGVIITAAIGNLSTPLSVRLRWRTYTWITQGGAIMQVVLIPVVLWTVGGGVISAATVATVTSGVALAAIFVVAAQLQPALRRPRVSRPVARRMLAFSVPLTIAGTAELPLTTADRILLGYYRSTVVVAYYTVAMRLATLASMIPAAASQPLFPAVIRLRASGQEAASRRLYRQILTASFLLFTPLLLQVALIARPFLTLWAGPAFGVHSAVPCYVLLFGVWISSLGWLAQTYLVAADFGPTIARIRLFQIPPYIAGAALLTMHFGLIGAAVAWSARTAIDAIAYFVLGWRAIRLPASPLSEHRVRCVLLLVVMALAVVAVAQSTSGLVPRAAYAAVLLGGYALVLWRLVLAESELALMGRFAKSLNPFSR
jgi:O-antigen/teichoic acid export membrane protein